MKGTIVGYQQRLHDGGLSPFPRLVCELVVEVDGNDVPASGVAIGSDVTLAPVEVEGG